MPDWWTRAICAKPRIASSARRAPFQRSPSPACSRISSSTPARCASGSSRGGMRTQPSEALFDRVTDELGRAVNAQLHHDVAAIRMNRLRADADALGHLLVDPAL